MPLRDELPPARDRHRDHRGLPGGAARTELLRAPPHRRPPVAPRSPPDDRRLAAGRRPRADGGHRRSTPWMRAILVVSAVPIAGLFAARVGGRAPPARCGSPPRRRRRDAPRWSSPAAGWPRSASPRRCAATGTTARCTWSAPSRRRPYDRPPLSKELLAGERAPASLRLRDDAVVSRQRRRAAPRRARRRASTRSAGGSRSPTAPSLRYERLLIATGAAPRGAAAAATASTTS